MCLTLVAVLGFVARVSGRVQFRQQQLLDLVRERLGPWFTDQLQLILLGVRNEAIVGGPVGLVALAIACLAIFVQLQSMFDSVWRPADSHEPNWLRTIWTVVRQRLIAFLMLLGVGGLLMLLFAANMVLAGAKVFVAPVPVSHTTWQTVQGLSVIGGNAVLMTILFKAIPRARSAGATPFAAACWWQ